ncbi:MAG: hypothetical protein AB7O97_24100 [Planctomycetota bacterium]
MLRLPSIVLLTTAVAVAQDHIIPLGFADAQGPTDTVAPANYPVARVKDNNLDGEIQVPDEVHAFVTTCFSTINASCFMTDGRAVLARGDYEFYFTDSQQARVVRGVDSNHNGVLDRGEDVNGNGVLDAGEDTNGNLVLDSEVTEFFFFEARTPTGTNPDPASFAPDTLGTYYDPITDQVRVYVAIDGNLASGAFPRGIHKLVDLNGDGDAKDPGEQSVFANSSIPLTTPVIGGALPNFYQLVRCLPNGKVVAFASGLAVPAAGPFSANENAFYAFTDSGGAAASAVELWFNCSQLNSLPLHPDFASGRFPVWDIDYDNGGVPTRRNFVRWLGVSERGGTAGVIPAYFIASSYQWSTTQTAPSFGDTNVNGEHVSGLIYRVDDINFNGSIDAGELSLWANLSGATYDGVAPVSFVNTISGLPITTLDTRAYGFDATADGEVSFNYDNNQNYAIVSLRDADLSGQITAGEVSMVLATAGPYPEPFHPSLGPYLDDFLSLEDGTLPGPFPAGITTSGSGCNAPTRNLVVLMDAFGGAPQIGNGNFVVGAIRATPGFPAILAWGTGFSPPIPLSGVGFPAGCTLDIQNPVTLAFGFSDARGRVLFGLPIPNVAGFIGQSIALQAGILDSGSPVPTPWSTTNALLLTIQP